MIFRGINNLALDAKGRMAMPARYRERLMETCGGRLVVTVDKDRCLLVYPLPEWEKKEQALLSMEHQQPHVSKMVRYLVGGSVECQSDKNGRILLPVHLRNSLKLDKEIVVNGMLTFFEVWSKKTWEKESIVTDQDFVDFDQTFNDLGMF